MANGELLLTHINQVMLYTHGHLIYTATPSKYTVRDIDFKAGSTRFTEVISNIDLTDEDKESVLAQLDYMDLSHLDLPINYKAMIQAVVTVPKVNTHTKSDYEYAGHRLAAAMLELAQYFISVGHDLSSVNLASYIPDMGTGDPASDVQCLTNISSVLNEPSVMGKLSKVTGYMSTFASEFSTYTAAQMQCLAYLKNLYASYATDAYKPNDLPYLAIRN